jgi:hypothetical protein
LGEATAPWMKSARPFWEAILREGRGRETTGRLDTGTHRKTPFGARGRCKQGI